MIIAQRKRLTAFFAFAFVALTIFSVLLYVKADGTTESEQEKAAKTLNLFEQADGVTYTAAVESPEYLLNGYSKNVYVTKEKLPKDHYSGVNVNVKTSNSTATFKNIFDVSDLTKETPLIEFYPIVNQRGTIECNSYTVTMQDADDENNFVKIHLKYAIWNWDCTQLSVSTDKITRRGYNSAAGNWAWETGYQFWYTLLSGYRIHGYYENGVNEREQWQKTLVEPFSIRYDNAEKCIYMAARYGGEMVKILDLTDETTPHVLDYGTAFKGFKNNRIRLSITADVLQTSETNFRIFNVLGMSLSGETVTDEAAPSLKIDIPDDGKAPYAFIGKKYDIFNAEGYDAVCGNVKPEVFIKRPDSETFEKTTDSSFIPDKDGIYKIKYYAKDYFDNEREQIVEVDARYGVPQTIIEIDGLSLDERSLGEYAVGSEIPIPAYSVSGGAGDLSVEVRVVRLSDNDECKIKGGAFTPYLAGEYAVIYTATDYVGTLYERAVMLTAKLENKPSVASELNIPKTLIDGAPVRLPEVAAYDYVSVSGTKLNAEHEITVRGDSGKSVTLGKDRVFTPSVKEFGSGATITYSIYCKNEPSYKTERSFTVKIKDGKRAADYFDYDESELAVTYNSNDEEDKYTRFTAIKEGDLTTGFINPIYETGAAVEFEIEYNNALSSNGMDAFRVDFYDSYDKNARVSLRLVKKDAIETIVEYGDGEYALSGGFNDENGNNGKTLKLELKNGVVYDYYGNKVVDLENSVGAKFGGFKSKYVTVSVTAENAKVGASFKIRSVRNQIFYGNYDGNGNVTDFADTVKPTVNFDFDYGANYTIGSKATIPFAYACDEITPYLKVTFTLVSPSGQRIYENRETENGLSFIVSEFGNYRITYSTTDLSGKTGEAYLTVSVKDTEAPSITLACDKKITARKGEEVMLPKATVLDNLDGEPMFKIFVISPSGIYSDCSEGKFAADKEGVYRVIYYAKDKNDNISVKEIELIVR